MLSDSIKSRIQDLYRQALKSCQLTPRYGQRLMIAEIAKTLGVLGSSDNETPPICVIEAGTGTGKTLAYLLGVVPLARELQLKVVIATATIALQEQVLGKDIPQLQRGTDLDFNVVLAKGRGRYLCLSRLDSLLRGSDSAQAMRDLYGEDLAPSGGNTTLYTGLMNAISAGEWDGDRDEWPQAMSDADWRPLTVDNAQCSGPKCSFFRNCCFFKARDAVDEADCIVTNHDLLLADLALGGGAILPEPEQCLYVIDEAHHLPVKSNAHFASSTRIRGTQSWLERCENLVRQLDSDDLLDSESLRVVSALKAQILDALQQTFVLLQALDDGAGESDATSRQAYTFVLGRVPESLSAQAAELSALFARLGLQFEQIGDRLQSLMDDESEAARQTLAEQWFPVVGSHVRRSQNALALWHDYAQPDPDDHAPMARWMTRLEQEQVSDLVLTASPVLAAANLREQLWTRCAGAVVTSATLSALGQFDTLVMRAGLPEHSHFVRIASPFDYTGAARLVVPRMNCLPSDTERHTQALVRGIPQLLDRDCAALMLFSSRRQMLDVLEGLPDDWRELVLCQDDYQKAQLLRYHRQRVDGGEGSVIFGLASFAEGIDLPGKYCTHVLIAKIPFAVPDEPVEKTLADWIERQGRNAFMTLAVPDAAMRLVQASGRLLRSETDTGQITVFDERLISRQYGKQMLASLPPYAREFFQLRIEP